MTGWLLKSWSAAHARVAAELNIVQIIRKRVRNLANYNSPKRWRTRCPNPLKWVEIHLKWKERFCRSGIPMRYCMTSQMGRTQAYRFFLLFELRYRSFFWFILPSRCSAVCTFPAVKMQAAIITIVLPSPPICNFSIPSLLAVLMPRATYTAPRLLAWRSIFMRLSNWHLESYYSKVGCVTAYLMVALSRFLPFYSFTLTSLEYYSSVANLSAILH